MKKYLLVLVCLCFGAAFLVAEPVVDGKVLVGEYAHTLSVLAGQGSLSWSQDAPGGLWVAMTATNKGWAAVGLGAKRMSGATMYLGFVGSDGKAVFSEQTGKGHRHVDAAAASADKSAVVQAGGTTVVEFHLASGKLPFAGKSIPFIAAFGPSADLTSFHEDNADSGTMVLP